MRYFVLAPRKKKQADTWKSQISDFISKRAWNTWHCIIIIIISIYHHSLSCFICPHVDLTNSYVLSISEQRKTKSDLWNTALSRICKNFFHFYLQLAAITDWYSRVTFTASRFHCEATISPSNSFTIHGNLIATRVIWEDRRLSTRFLTK